MQSQLPLFPSSVKLINATLGFRKDEEGVVYYLHNGSPIFCHKSSDLNNYRYIAASLVSNHLCTVKELSTALGVSRRNIERYSKQLREKGSDWFFHRVEKRGDCYKLTKEHFQKAEELLSASQSIASVARTLQVTEGALRYHIRKGTIKKR